MEFKKSLSYSDVILQPSYSEVRSRSELDVSVNFLGKQFRSCVIPANMKCVIDFNMATNLSEQCQFYVLHRFYEYKDILEWVKNNQLLRTISISVGVGKADRTLIISLQKLNLRVDYITIDVAHGHHILVKEMIEFIRELDGDVKIIAGNIGTMEAARDLQKWGADAVKVGLSMGKSCTTYNCTGVGTPMFSTVFNITSNTTIPIIADGQVREVGDVCKALVAGASMVMIGSEFAKCSDSPAEIKKEYIDFTSGAFVNKKVFYGSASSDNKGNSSYIEGQKVLLEMRDETYLQYMTRINEGIQSCMSYAGVSDIKKLPEMKRSIRNTT